MIYKYRCKKCNKLFDGFSSISGRNKVKKCSCGGSAYRDFENELKEKGRFNELEMEHPRWSWALGINPNQIEKALKVHPGAVFNEKGQMLIENRTKKLQRLKEAKMIEF